MEIAGYAIGAAEDKKLFPPALTELICRLERLRVRAALRLIHHTWCSAGA